MTTKRTLEGSVALRHINFLSLLHQFKESEMPDEPERGLLKAFSERVGVSDRYLSHVKCERKLMGPKTARKIEEALKLPVGWMDMPQGGAIIADNPQQKADLELFQTLLRAEPNEARALMTEIIKATLEGVGRTKKGARTAKSTPSEKNAA